MKLFFGFSILFFLGNNRKTAPSYNPFDTLFDISRDKLEEDSCKMIGGMCGWFNLTKKIDDLEVYYQFFELEEEVVAKGFSLVLDTINVKDIPFMDDMKRDSLVLTTPINTQLIQVKVEKYNVVLEKVTKKTGKYEYPEINVYFRTPSKELIIGHIDFEYCEQGFIIRSLVVYRSRQIYKKNTPIEDEFTDEMELI